MRAKANKRITFEQTITAAVSIENDLRIHVPMSWILFTYEMIEAICSERNLKSTLCIHFHKLNRLVYITGRRDSYKENILFHIQTTKQNHHLHPRKKRVHIV